MNAKEILDQEFLTIRSRLLDIAAALDRIQRAEGDTSSDPRMAHVSDAIEIVGSQELHRAERVQLLFSREYDEAWKSRYELDSRA